MKKVIVFFYLLGFAYLVSAQSIALKEQGKYVSEPTNDFNMIHVKNAKRIAKNKIFSCKAYEMTNDFQDSIYSKRILYYRNGFVRIEQGGEQTIGKKSNVRVFKNLDFYSVTVKDTTITEQIFNDAGILANTRYYQYDKKGNLVLYENVMEANADFAIHVKHIYSYNDTGNLIEDSLFSSADFENDPKPTWRMTYDYDDNGNLITLNVFNKENELKQAYRYYYSYW